MLWFPAVCVEWKVIYINKMKVVCVYNVNILSACVLERHSRTGWGPDLNEFYKYLV